MALDGVSILSLVVALSWTVFAYDRDRLAQIPPRQRNFRNEQWMGTWYLQARLASCLWSGSNQFDDWEVKQTLQPDGSILAVETWRSSFGECTTIQTQVFDRSGGNGSFAVKDPIGDVLSGEQIVVATDYKTICVMYGCVKRSVDGSTCEDPWVTLMTRERHPTPNTFTVLEVILQKFWSLSLAEMRRIKHTNACNPPLLPEDMIRLHPQRDVPYSPG